jgi:hypothetical protein
VTHIDWTEKRVMDGHRELQAAKDASIKVITMLI